MFTSSLRKLFGFALCATVMFVLPAAEGSQKGRLNQVMIDKLRFSQALLQGIALGDFAKITSSAEELLALSRTAEWLANKTPRYEQHSNTFQMAVETLIQKSKAKNIDGVVLAYQDMTMSCVRCHQYLREVRDARAPDLRDDTRVAHR